MHRLNAQSTTTCQIFLKQLNQSGLEKLEDHLFISQTTDKRAVSHES